MIELNEEYEVSWLEKCLHQPEDIQVLPVETWHKFMDYLAQEERYSDMFLLAQVRSKVVDLTMEEILEQSEVIYNSEWDEDDLWAYYMNIIMNSDSISDEDLANRMLTLYTFYNGEEFEIPDTIIDMMRDRALQYCQDLKKGVYDGPLPIKEFNITL